MNFVVSYQHQHYGVNFVFINCVSKLFWNCLFVRRISRSFPPHDTHQGRIELSVDCLSPFVSASAFMHLTSLAAFSWKWCCVVNGDFYSTFSRHLFLMGWGVRATNWSLPWGLHPLDTAYETVRDPYLPRAFWKLATLPGFEPGPSVSETDILNQTIR